MKPQCNPNLTLPNAVFYFDIMRQKLEEVEALIKQLKTIKSNLKKRDRLRDKAAWGFEDGKSPKQVSKLTAELNFQCMYLDQSIVKFARDFEKSTLNVSTEEKI